MVEIGVDGIKLYLLYIVKGSIMVKVWEVGCLNGIELEDYMFIVGEMIRYMLLEVIYYCIFVSVCRLMLFVLLWCENRWMGMVELDRYLNEYGV